MGFVRLARALTIGQTAVGCVLVLIPAQSGRAVAGVGRGGAGSGRAAGSGAGQVAPVWLIRVLGVRMAGQGALVHAALRSGRRAGLALWLGAAVDALHTVSMVLGGARWPSYRRSALVSAALAGASAAVEMIEASTGAGPDPAGMTTAGVRI